MKRVAEADAPSGQGLAGPATVWQSIVALPELALRLDRYAQQRRFRLGQRIAAAGDPATHLLLVTRGRVHLIYHSASGNALAVRTATVGNFLAEYSLLPDARHEGDLVTAESTEVWMIPRQALVDAVRQDPQLAVDLLLSFADGMVRMELHIIDLGRLEIKQRIAGAIMHLATRGNVTASDVWLPAPWAAFATWLGTTPETVSRELRELARAGIISVRGTRGIQILDPAALRRASGDG
jgi:CRP/FNR family transcriptional regulator